VKDFFNIPIGLISRVDKTLINSDAAKKGKSQQNKENTAEIHTKDGRLIKLSFPRDPKMIFQFSKVMEHVTFFDTTNPMQLKQLEMAFPYSHKIEINQLNWINFSDGWLIYSDILGEAKRQGIDLKRQSKFQLIGNVGYKLCQTYPNKIILPRAIN